MEPRGRRAMSLHLSMGGVANRFHLARQLSGLGGGHLEHGVEKDSEAESVPSEKEGRADRLPVSTTGWKYRVAASCSVFVHPGRISGVSWMIQEIRLEKRVGGHTLKTLKCHAEVY